MYQRKLFLPVLIITILFTFVLVTGCDCDDNKEIKVEILAEGGSVKGANGIFFDEDDQLYIASVIGKSISVMNPDKGDIIHRLGPDQGIEGPDDLAFGPDGSLYWTSFLIGEVGRLMPDGNVQTQFVPG